MSLRIGIIGSGFAALHIKALENIKEANVVVVCSKNETGAKQLIGDKNTAYYKFEHYKNMLQHENLDAVYVCIPPFLHGELEKECSKHVKALFIEKPVTLDYRKGKTLLDFFEKQRNITGVGYMNRYRKALQSAKNYFKEDKPVLINAAWCDDMPPPYWWRQREMSGGQMTEQCTHFIDAVRYIAGEITEVSAYAANGFVDDIEDFNVDDAVVMNIRLASGAIGNIMTSCYTKEHKGGTLGLFVNISSREKAYRFTNHAMDLQIQHTNDEIEVIPNEEDVIIAENRAFIDAILKNNQSLILSSYEDALKTAKVGFAADLSIKENRTVKLSEL